MRGSLFQKQPSSIRIHVCGTRPTFCLKVSGRSVGLSMKITFAGFFCYWDLDSQLYRLCEYLLLSLKQGFGVRFG